MLDSTSTITDRYVDAVARQLPAPDRPERARRLRATLDADIAHRVATGASPAGAERDAVIALGDPDRLAAGYTGRPLHLIGPALYLDWVRLLRLLLLVVLPIVAIVLAVTQALASLPLSAIVVSTVSTVVSVGMGLAFWTTVVFAIIERARPGDAPLTTWTPDDLPADPARNDVGIGDLIGGVLAIVLLIGGIVWQATASPFVDADGALITFFAPALWPWWIAYFVAVMLGELAFAIALYRRRSWGPTMAAVNVALNAAFTVPFVTLLVRDEIVNPAFSAEFAGTGMVLLGQQSAVWVALGVIALAVGDSIDGIVKSARAARGSSTRSFV